MSHQHERIVCSCGTLIMQCRCMESGRNVRVVQNGCDDCKRKGTPMTAKDWAPMHCGQPATPAMSVPGWTCGECGAVFQVRGERQGADEACSRACSSCDGAPDCPCKGCHPNGNATCPCGDGCAEYKPAGQGKIADNRKLARDEACAFVRSCSWTCPFAPAYAGAPVRHSAICDRLTDGLAIFRAKAYAAGRAAERERCEGIARNHHNGSVNKYDQEIVRTGIADAIAKGGTT